ncbi:OmpA family protein [Galbibacter pacificus]|uniref:OmpA family protein n=1 Tax=Galbibacter pacificus TaxID=2996052 RepID=A0ABT6FUQ4_9FLAO|nr:OmpA family protein [Galbibacter pacificus]MDG3583531.1 OmpA family protein [Galbibacter pacificus]MDG3586993.1 OmpA family protein [Galbibacter pacificus]
MKTLLRYSFVLFLFLEGFSLNAQYGKQKKADALFNKYSFIKSSQTYKELIDNNYNVAYAERKLADCYFMLRDPENAAIYYKKAIQQPNIPIDYYYNYAVVLRGLGEYEEADTWLKKFKKEGGKNKMVRELKKEKPVLFNVQTKYTLQDVNFNTEYSDFGAYRFGDILYYISAKNGTQNPKKVYSWNEQPFLDMYTINLNDSLNTVTPVVGDINTKFHEGPISISSDGKTMYFSRNNYYQNHNERDQKGVNHLQIYKASLVNGKWTNITDMPFNNANYSVSHPALSNDGKLLYFSSDMPGGHGKADIYKVTIQENGTFGTPENLGPIVNTEGEELFPFINSEGTLFFSSDGHEGIGLLDIYGTIKNEENEITDIVNLGEPINSKKDDFSFFMFSDGLSGYMASNRNNKIGNDDIYAFETVLPLMLKGVVSDSINGKPIPNAKISLKNNLGSEIAYLLTDENGYYEINIDRRKDYSISASQEKYTDKTKIFTSKNIGKKITEIVVNLQLVPLTDIKILAGLNTIYFDFDKYNIRPDAAKELDKIVNLMTAEYPEMVMKIESHTDSRGSLSYNDRLSIDRANATYDYLISKGLTKERVIAHKGYGERRLTNGCSDGVACEEPEHQKNRRTDFIVLKMK